jgi:hypothetical protein
MRETERRTRRYFCASRFLSMASKTVPQRSVSRRALLREKNFDDHRADGYQSS